VPENEQPVAECRFRPPGAFYERWVGRRREIAGALDAPLRARVGAFAQNE